MLTGLILGGGFVYWYGLIKAQRLWIVAGAITLLLTLLLLVVEGNIDPAAIVVIALASMVIYALQRYQKPIWRAVGWSLFVLFILALGFRLLPFFTPVTLMPPLAEQTYVFRTEKLVLLLLLPPMVLLPWSHRIPQLPHVRPWLVSILIGFIILLTTIPIAVSTGFVSPGIPQDPVSLLVYWLGYNLLYTCVLEEAFFRGIVQTAFVRVFSQRLRLSYARLIAIVCAALLFGLAHFGGGWSFVLLATIAGIGYGIVYDLTGRLHYAVLVHFGVNAVRLLAFSGT